MLAGAYSANNNNGWKKTLEKKIKHDAVLEHQRAHNHRESSLLRFGSERERSVEGKKRKNVVGFADGRVSGAAAGATGVIEFQFENLNKNAIKTTLPDGTSSPDYQIYWATHIFICKLVARMARVWVWVRVWRNLFHLPFSLLIFFSSHSHNFSVARASVTSPSGCVHWTSVAQQIRLFSYFRVQIVHQLIMWPTLFAETETDVDRYIAYLLCMFLSVQTKI